MAVASYRDEYYYSRTSISTPVLTAGHGGTAQRYGCGRVIARHSVPGRLFATHLLRRVRY
eukprot:2218602-Rhodomonas_salina.2